MDKWQRRTVGYLVVLVAVLAGYSVLYHWGMATFEGREGSFLHSVQVVVETFTTTGFGSDSPWESPEMNLIVIAMDLTGVALIFMTLPLFIFPLFEEALSTSPPAVSDLDDHVVVCSYSPRGETLRKELDAAEMPWLFVVDDHERALELYETDYEVIHGDPEDVEVLRAAGVERARAVVADVDDETNPSVVLAAKEVNSDVEVASIVEDDTVAQYHRYAGADTVVTPRFALGESLATKATASFSADLNNAVELDEEFEVTELLVQKESDIAGKTLAESGLRDRMGVTVVGAWFRGEFVASPSPQTVIDEHTVLVVAGEPDKLTRVKARTLPRGDMGDTVIVGGYGAGGRVVAEALADTGVRPVVVDREEKEGVDVVGDITDEETLRRAGIEDARSVVLTLGEDTATIFAALVVERTAPDIELIVRANEAENVSKLYRAGAEYVLAISTVTGRMLASSLLDEEIITPDAQFDLVRLEAPGLVGRSLGDADVRSKTGCTVVAVERGAELLTDTGPSFVVREGDTLIVAGDDASVSRFTSLLG